MQEAFKAVEDIHYLMSLSKRPPKPQMLANFHNKLCLVFWKAGNMLFHACARHRLFHLTRDMKKNPTMDDLARYLVELIQLADGRNMINQIINYLYAKSCSMPINVCYSVDTFIPGNTLNVKCLFNWYRE